MNTADVIDRAADLIWVNGRCIGVGSEDGKFCIVGAVVHVLVDEQNLRDTRLTNAMHDVSRAINDYLSTDDVTEFASTFNDRLPISPENDALVIDTLRRCSKELRERGE